MNTASKTYSKHLLRYKDPAKRTRDIRAWKIANPARVSASNAKSNLKAKTEALSHYGKGGIMMCNWDGCAVDDIDMLTLDHVKNDGLRDRTRGGNGTGIDIYRRFRAHGWPEGIQTLCWNHQWKKELIRRREAVSDRRQVVTP